MRSRRVPGFTAEAALSRSTLAWRGGTVRFPPAGLALQAAEATHPALPVGINWGINWPCLVLTTTWTAVCINRCGALAAPLRPACVVTCYATGFVAGLLC